MLIIKRLAFSGGFLFFGTSLFAEMYTNYHVKWGKKNFYEMSQWKDSIDDEKRKAIITAREPVVETIKRLFSFKEVDTNSVSHIFADDLNYEDPIFKCNDRVELFDMHQFCVERHKNQPVKIEKFDPFHSQNCIHISYQREAAFLIRFSKKLSSTMIVTLEDNKVVSIIDEWNSVPIISIKNKPVLGRICLMFRRFQFRFGLLRNNFRSYVIAVMNF